MKAHPESRRSSSRRPKAQPRKKAAKRGEDETTARVLDRLRLEMELMLARRSRKRP